jgi:hypothetical protein
MNSGHFRIYRRLNDNVDMPMGAGILNASTKNYSF